MAGWLIYSIPFCGLAAILFLGFCGIFRFQTYQTVRRFFALLFSVVYSSYVLSLLCSWLKVAVPGKVGYAEFYKQIAARVPSGQADFGWISALAKPIYLAIKLLDTRFHDLGLAVVVFSVVVYFAYSLATYGYRSRLSEYQRHLTSIRWIYANDPAELARQAAAIQRIYGFKPATGFCLLLLRLLFLFVLYQVFTRPDEFRKVTTILPVSDLSSPAPGLGLVAVGAVAVFLQAVLQNQACLTLPLRIASGLFGGLLTGLIFWFIPSGLVVVMTTVALTDVVQSLYENRLRTRSPAKSLVPALAIIPLLFVVLPKGPGSATVARQSEAPQEARQPARELPKATPAPTSVTSDLRGRLEALVDAGKIDDAIRNVEAELGTGAKDGDPRALRATLLHRAAANQIRSGRERFVAYSYLEQARQFKPDETSISRLLGELYLQVAQEELANACVRKGPSDFYSLLGHAKIGEVLSVRSITDKPDNWVPVVFPGASDGWIYGPLVQAHASVLGERQVRIAAKRARAEVRDFLDKAQVLYPGLKGKRIWIEHKNLILASLILLSLAYVAYKRIKVLYQ
jgi:membrane protein insertase Oxa1/YidC/SpoIIIJ